MSNSESNDAVSGGRRDRGKWPDRMKRRAGCLWGCLTEPLVILFLVAVALLTGRYLWRRRSEESSQTEGRE